MRSGHETRCGYGYIAHLRAVGGRGQQACTFDNDATELLLPSSLLVLVAVSHSGRIGNCERTRYVQNNSLVSAKYFSSTISIMP